MSDCAASSESVDRDSKRRRVTYANTPLALTPNSAIEIARNAKW